MFSKMTVAMRLYLGFGLLLAVLVAVTTVAVFKVQIINGSLRANSETHAAVQRYAINFRGSAHDRAIAVRDVVLSASPGERQSEVAAIDRLAAFYAQSADPLEALIGAPGASPELATLYAGIKTIERQAVDTTKAVIAAVDGGDMAQAQSLLWTKAKPQYVLWLAAINQLIDFEEERIQAENKIATEQASGFLTVMLFALAAALALGGALAWMIPRSILSQLGAEPVELGGAAQRVANGNLSAVPNASQAPVGSVLSSLGSMQSGLFALVGRVRAASDSIATGSQQIAQDNNDLSARTEQQASALEQTAASMETLGATVKQNADSARQANQLAMSASTVAVQGGEVVSQVVETMKGINDSSRKIADIISVIDGIAFQTNILALNAAVEAARAGEQGRGFAVVASEVRSLAGRSAEAAKEIKTLIGASVERVTQGTALVDKAGATMTEVVSSIKRVTDIMGEISAASNEQASGVAQVGEAVRHMDQATQQNAALVERMAEAASSLKGQAQDLVQTVSTFDLGAGDTGFRSAREPTRSSLAMSKPPEGPARRLTTAKSSLPSNPQRVSLPKPVSAAAPQFASKGKDKPTTNTGDDDWETF